MKTDGLWVLLFAGSRYIYDLYYEKEAISKKLYEWLLKNNYADAMLIAKWKKQGYEKVSVVAQSFDVYWQADANWRLFNSCAAYAASRPRRQTSTAHASAACPENS